MITWTKLEDEVPAADKEFIAFNPEKESRKKSTILKYGKGFTEDMIRTRISDEGYTLWCYVA